MPVRRASTWPQADDWMRMQTRDRRTARLVLVALAAAFALLGAGAGTAAAAPAATAKVTNTCWQDVVNDWLNHNGTIQNTYPIPCYTQAIQHLSGYADIQGYSNVIDDIHRALLAAIHQDQRGGPPTSGLSGPNSPGGGGGGGNGGGHGGGWIQSVADAIGPGNARSIPLPLLVLGALALLLLLAAAGTWFAKRLQARRIAPAPAPARAPQQPR
jgi:hypothetical protein